MENPFFRRKVSSDSLRRLNLPRVHGFKLRDLKVSELVSDYKHLGFQATHLGRACDIAKKMLDEDVELFFTFTSNIVSSGLREVVAEMCRHKLVKVIVTTTGSVEEDVMKTLNQFLIGRFDLDDEEVKANGMNRLGNLLVPDEHYVAFEEWHNSFMEKLWEEEKEWSPSDYIKRLGEAVKDEHSFLYWASRNNIPVYCPGFLDGAIGDHLYYFNKAKKRKGLEELRINIAPDIETFYDRLAWAEKVGGLIIGGGIAKHHLIGASQIREGIEYAVYVTTAEEFDGSLSGAKPSEAVSWNKVKSDRENYVEVHAEATLVLPLIAVEMYNHVSKNSR